MNNMKSLDQKPVLNKTMTLTLLRVVPSIIIVGLCGITHAGACKDYVGCTGDSEERTEEIAPQNKLMDNTISYEAAEESEKDYQNDPRVEQVRRFFAKYKCPAIEHTELFIRVADENNLDWRLLPTIAFVESSGGKRYINNNIFGWASGEKEFESVEAGIIYVGNRLAKGPYKGKTTEEKLRVYNPFPHYIPTAKKVMRWLSRS